MPSGPRSTRATRCTEFASESRRSEPVSIFFDRATCDHGQGDRAPPSYRKWPGGRSGASTRSGRGWGAPRAAADGRTAAPAPTAGAAGVAGLALSKQLCRGAGTQSVETEASLGDSLTARYTTLGPLRNGRNARQRTATQANRAAGVPRVQGRHAEARPWAVRCGAHSAHTDTLSQSTPQRLGESPNRAASAPPLSRAVGTPRPPSRALRARVGRRSVPGCALASRRRRCRREAARCRGPRAARRACALRRRRAACRRSRHG